MRYLSVDIETTGLNPFKHQILEIAAILDDLEYPQPITTFHCYVRHEQIIGDPIAIGMNVELIKKIANPETKAYATHQIANEFECWLYDNKIEKITCAGKNFSGFDRLFLKQLACWNDSWFHHRSFDLGSMYFEKGDKEIPSLQKCTDRAGLNKQVLHTAMDDTLLVVQLMRHKFAS